MLFVFVQRTVAWVSIWGECECECESEREEKEGKRESGKKTER